MDRLFKLFMLDTNVILSDCGCLQKFREHDVAIPITVLEEQPCYGIVPRNAE